MPMPPEQARAALREAAQQLDVALSTTQQGALLGHWLLLQKWNRVYNLTAVRDPADMLTHHLIDSLAVVPALIQAVATLDKPNARVLDVGSGAGFPGAVLAIAMPELHVTCVDAVEKKVVFIRQVAAELSLSNLHVEHSRVEQLGNTFDVVTSRAFASLQDFVTATRATLATGGVWMAMKAKRPDGELAELGNKVDVFHVEQLNVPGLDAERCIVWMRPSQTM